MKRWRTAVLVCVWILGLITSPFLEIPAAAAEPPAKPGYQKPPKAITDILDAPPTPTVSVSPTRDRLLLVQGVRYPPIADLAEPMLRLAGHRINPKTNGPHRPPRVVGMTLQTIADGKQMKVQTPGAGQFGAPAWSPDGKHFAFTNTTADAIELWVGDAQTGTTRKMPGVALNAALGQPVQWMPDSRALLCETIPAGRGQPPAPPRAPEGPVVQESSGKAAPVRTFQDLLRNNHDEDLFDYYATAQLALVDTEAGRATSVGKPAIFDEIEPSPDAKHLLVRLLHKPYSYLLPSYAFPRELEVWDLTGKMEFKLASLPVADQVPIDGVPTGPRSAHWRPTEPATVVWVEALDDGNPKKKVPHRDRLLQVRAPFDAKPVELANTEHRFFGLTWAEKDGQAFVQDFERDRRWVRTFLLNADKPEGEPRLLWERSILDRYRDRGTPMMRTLPNGQHVMCQQGDAIFLHGQGASKAGVHPFLDRVDLKTLKSERLFRSDNDGYETVVALLSNDGSQVLTHRETPTDPPNYYLRSLKDEGRKALTDFKDPAPALRNVKKQLVTYKRADGVQLSFTLYLPPDYKPGQRLPTVVWAYPREFTDADTAGQVTTSPNRFITVAGPSHLFFLLQGYAILDDATMPVIGTPEKANDTYIEQIVSSAKAAIDKAAEMGVTDPERVGVGGHSYGAFMTANLLAHSDLFRAGIARSGAYNRTLTPFGFQAERRTLWEAPSVYMKVSPFLAADKIKQPLLLIHGEADDNPGTFPVQSERMYQAVRGNGGTVRFVSLPYEAHGYQARESVEHTLYEMITWFDRHVKNAPTRTPAK
jgi:dipeptidyl aminopeptidase/acylaminoacyl peptidase